MQILDISIETHRCTGVCVKRRTNKQVLGTSTSTALPAGDGAHDEKRLVAFGNRVGQGSIDRFV